MNRIFLTGDTHSDVSRILRLDMPELTKEDYVIILGDFGVIWRNDIMMKAVLKQLSEKNFTVCFVDGNHENFDMISKIEYVVPWHGGMAGIIAPGVVHLLRGQIYQIGDRTIGVCGGANSIDKAWRTENVSWWPQEVITDEEVSFFQMNLIHKGVRALDLMLTHDCPASIVPAVALWSGINGASIDKSEEQLEKIKQMVEVKKWYFGHWHINRRIDETFECLYEDIKEV